MVNFLVLIKLFFVLILVLCSAFFSGSEVALFSLSMVRRKKLENSEKRSGEILRNFWERPGQLLNTILVANEVTNIVATSLLTSVVIYFLGESWGGLSIFIMVPLLLTFGEVIPKTVAMYRAEAWAEFCAYPLFLVSRVILPALSSLQFTANKFFVLLKLDDTPYVDSYTKEEFKTLLSLSNLEGVLESEEQKMIENVLEFSSTRVKDIMTPRAEIFAFKVQESVLNIISQIKKTPYSRIPIYDKTLDNVKGILYSRDLLMATTPRCWEENTNIELKKLVQPAFFVPVTQTIGELLKSFQKRKVHIAIVVDEYGGTAGLITLEDLLEEIFGEIIDEHDTEEKMVSKLKGKIYIVSALMSLDDFNEEFSVKKPLEGATNLGGYLLNAFGHVPKRGERLKYDGMEFIVRRSKATRVTHVLVKLTTA